MSVSCPTGPERVRRTASPTDLRATWARNRAVPRDLVIPRLGRAGDTVGTSRCAIFIRSPLPFEATAEAASLDGPRTLPEP